MPLLGSWDLEPSILLGCAGLLIGALAQARWRPRQVKAPFLVVLGILLLALVSPLDVLSDDYLFSAHMVQHLLLVLVVPPLMLVGLPADGLRATLRVPAIHAVERFLSRRPAALAIGVGTLAAWHLPRLYNAALADEELHVIEHLCFLVAATIFWWPIFTPLPERRLRLARALVYVLVGAWANALIGFVLFAAPAGIYPAYLHPEDPLGVLPMVRQLFTPSEDQRFGGLLMVLGGSFPFAGAVFWILWTHREERARANHQPA